MLGCLTLGSHGVACDVGCKLQVVMTQAMMRISLCRFSVRSTVSVAMLRESRTDVVMVIQVREKHDASRKGCSTRIVPEWQG